MSEKTISLPLEYTAFIDAKVASGAFASATEVVEAGLQVLQERDAIERWLRNEVASTYDAMEVDPAQALAVSTVSDDIRAHHMAKLKAGS